MQGSGTDLARRKSRRRLPHWVETELAKLFCTLGFADYGAALWDLANAPAETAVRPTASVPDEILRQIEAQAAHDPCVGAGAAALARLPQIDASRLDHMGVDVAGLFQHVAGRVETLVMVPRRADLDHAIPADLRSRAAPDRRILAIVLDETSEAGRSSGAPPAAEGLTCLVWRDHCRDAGAVDPRLLAMFAHALGPAVILVGGSPLARQMLAQFGRALKPFHRLVALVAAAELEPARQSATLRLLRPAVPQAVLLADTEATAAILAKRLGLRVATIAVAAAGGGEALFDADPADRRSPRDIEVARGLLGPGRLADPPPLTALRPDAPDISVILLCHREGALMVPALASLRDLLDTARAAGVSVEARAVLDRGDPATAAVLAGCGWLDGVTEVAFGDPGPSRNAGARAARGRFCAFLDGDDLWGANWLLRAFAAANTPTGQGAIWHPEYLYLFHEGDSEVAAAPDRPPPPAQSCFLKQASSAAPGFDARGLLLDNLWSANAFARREIFLAFPYRSSVPEAGHGIEDWRWNLETLGLGVPHHVVPGTVHLIRVKDGDSLSKRHAATALLPILV